MKLFKVWLMNMVKLVVMGLKMVFSKVKNFIVMLIWVFGIFVGMVINFMRIKIMVVLILVVMMVWIELDCLFCIV